ncbi:hypothetical protein N7497_010459 [Penicillium chrysogenum]|nr:hypothetical protein N7497_010459 [Penicillium chrysogenum]
MSYSFLSPNRQNDLSLQEPEQRSVAESDGSFLIPFSSDPELKLVTWSGPEDPTNPLNWSHARKWSATLLVSCFTFISPVSSTMVAPALGEIAHDFNITSDIERYLVMSIFLLAYALGPFILAPLSEMYGRVVVLQSANMVYLIFNTVCGFATSREQILAFRFLSGLGGSAPQANERGAATAVYSVMPFIGPAIGPIAGGYLTQYMSWQWIFWIVSMADAVVQILAFLFLRETYAPKILATKKKMLQRESQNQMLYTEYDEPDRTFLQLLRKNLVRPFRMLFTQPAIQAVALYRGYQYGLMYLVLASFPTVWEGKYGQSKGRASLNYISLGVGFVIGLQFCGRLIDIVYERLAKHYGDTGRPEYRLPLMIPGGAHSPNIGAALFAIGLIICFQCCQTYVIDAYTRYAASATGVTAFVRTMAGFSFPLFADSLYRSLGLGWGNSLLGFISLGMGIVAPALLWFYGEWMRAKSPYCAGDETSRV